MSARLLVSDFSCLKEADLKLGRWTVLIGPQASGKSVLSKLVYFFNQILSDQFQTLEDGQGLASFKEEVRSKFKEWFPVAAWGGSKFCIEFVLGDYSVRLTRVEKKGVPSDNLRITFSSFFENYFHESLELFNKVRGDGAEAGRGLETFWKTRETATSALREGLGEQYFDFQTFIPAGRSFFTSLGKSIAVFEHGRTLDPLILQFGRYYANIRERSPFRYRDVASPDMPWQERLQGIMGGVVVSDRTGEYLKASDGRKIPISALSSGQQELMPLLFAINAISTTPRRYRRLVTIEEPEAHLFPAAQSSLVEVLASLLNFNRGSMSLITTTHSPYVLAKLNNLMKAHRVANTVENSLSRIVRIVPRRALLPPNDVAAFAICDGKLKSIMDESESLIDASYLDSISGDISREFSKLLELEYGS